MNELTIEQLEKEIQDRDAQVVKLRAEMREFHAVLDEKNAAALAAHRAGQTPAQKALAQKVG